MAIALSRCVVRNLTRGALRVAAALASISCVGACAIESQAPESPDATKSTYVDVWHTFQSTVHSYRPTLDDSIRVSEELGGASASGWEVDRALAVDCSDTKVRCIADSALALAVPESGLDRQTYEARGVRFKVEKCRRGDPDHCSVALVSGTCDQISDVSPDDAVQCLSNPSMSSAPITDVAFVVYFVYNEGVGVTAFGIAREPLASEADQLAIVTQSVLTSGPGLLCCRP